MARLKALWHDIADSLWFLPALLTLAAGGLALVLVRLDARLDLGRRPELWWLFGGGADGARGVLGAIAGSVMTVTGVVFSVTIVALQLASSQYTPRLLRQFMADRANQLVLGVFIGTFTYTLLVQRTVRGAGEEIPMFVPSIAVTGAVVLALISIGFLIFFINHAARSIQASVIIDRVAHETLRALATTFPDSEEVPGAVKVPDSPPQRVRAGGTGYVQAIGDATLLKLAAQHGLLVRVERSPGEFVMAGELLASAWSEREVDEGVTGEVQGALHLGMMRTPHQDPTLGVIELVDVAVKALSPSINDPTTAINVLDRLGEVLLAAARCPQQERVLCDQAGTPRVLLVRPKLPAILQLAIDPVRHFGAGVPAVAAHLLTMLGRTMALAPAWAQADFRAHIERVLAASLRVLEDPYDRDLIRTAAERALSARTTAPQPSPSPSP